MSEIFYNTKLKKKKRLHCQSEKRIQNWHYFRALFYTVLGIRIIAFHTISLGLR